MTDDQSYEKELLASLENGEWRPVKGQKKENQRYRELATEALRKSRRANIRISAMDLEGLQAKAAEEDLPYRR
jgi:predicted DNA binding CopG/RHH family protein